MIHTAKAKKRSFVLLELMIALSLVTLCAAPLIHSPYLHAKKQRAALEKIQLQLESEKALAEVKERLYSHDLPWSIIEDASKKGVMVREGPLYVPILESSYTLTCRMLSAHICSGKDEELMARATLEVSFRPQNSKKKPARFLHTLVFCQKEDSTVPVIN